MKVFPRVSNVLGEDIPIIPSSLVDVRKAIPFSQSMGGHETNTVIMNKGCHNHEHVKYLMRLEPEKDGKRDRKMDRMNMWKI